MSPAALPEMPIPFGISADTGLPLEGIDAAALDELREGGRENTDLTEHLAAKSDSSAPHYGTIGDVDPNDLNQTGWAVIFSPNADQRIKDAIQPLLDLRQQQVGDGGLFRIFEGETGFRAGDTAEIWLKRQGVGMDVVDPQMGVPFYIAIVAPPDEISYEFQYGLDLYWGVGRIWFPHADDFRQYADSVIRYETMAQVPNSRQMAVFAPRHDYDAATELFAGEVAEPLVAGSERIAPIGKRQKFITRSFIGDSATKDSLNQVFTGTIEHGPPAVVFSGGHGKSFRSDDPRQTESMGSLICQDWSGSGIVQRDQYFDAADLLSANAKVHGMVHFLFACYGGGWPVSDSFNRLSDTPKVISDRPMMSRLPQALLSHPNGGALAVLAHVDRAWAYSFRSGSNAQTQGFRDVIGRIMRADRLGQATDQFNIRWAALSAGLSEDLDDARRLGKTLDQKILANKWVARDDARNYVLFGDPAVRLRSSEQDMPSLVQA